MPEAAGAAAGRGGGWAPGSPVPLALLAAGGPPAGPGSRSGACPGGLPRLVAVGAQRAAHATRRRRGAGGAAHPRRRRLRPVRGGREGRARGRRGAAGPLPGADPRRQRRLHGVQGRASTPASSTGRRRPGASAGWSGRNGRLEKRWAFTSDWKPDADRQRLQRPRLRAGLPRRPRRPLPLPAGRRRLGAQAGQADRAGCSPRVSPVGPLDPDTYVAGPLTADAAGNVYYNALKLSPRPAVDGGRGGGLAGEDLPRRDGADGDLRLAGPRRAVGESVPGHLRRRPAPLAAVAGRRAARGPLRLAAPRPQPGAGRGRGRHRLHRQRRPPVEPHGVRHRRQPGPHPEVGHLAARPLRRRL